MRGKATLAAIFALALFATPAHAAPIPGARYYGTVHAAHAGKLALGLTLGADRRSFDPPGARDWQGSRLVASRSLPCVGDVEWALDGRVGTHIARAGFRVRRSASHG